MTHLRGKALSPTAALPCSPLRALLHTSSIADFLRSLSQTNLPTSTILPDRRLRIAEAALFGCGSSGQCFGRK